MAFLTGLVDKTERVGNAIRAYIKQITGSFVARQSCKLSQPFGRYSNPINESQTVMMYTGSFKQDPYVIGYLQDWNANWQWSLMQGESVDTSLNFALKYDNVAGLRAYKLDNEEFVCTLPNGEFVGEMILNRINEIEELISVLNSNLSNLQSVFNNHTHLYAPGPGSPTPTANPATPFNPSPAPSPATLSNDTDYINNENYLIGENAENYGA